MPKVAPGLDEAWEAFHDLAATRQAGMDANPIPMHEFAAWCELREVARARRWDLWKLVRQMDAEILSVSRDRQEQERTA